MKHRELKIPVLTTHHLGGPWSGTFLSRRKMRDLDKIPQGLANDYGIQLITHQNFFTVSEF